MRSATTASASYSCEVVMHEGSLRGRVVQVGRAVYKIYKNQRAIYKVGNGLK